MPFIQKKGLILGVDPDIDKSGLAVLNLSSRTLEVGNFRFPELLDRIRELHSSVQEGDRFVVIVEAGWLNKGNWHVTESRNGKFSPQAWAAAVGVSQGENGATSKLLLECLQHEGIQAVAKRPLRKCWKGKDGKISHAELVRECELYRINFKDKRSNQEERDAALLSLFSI